jgi:DNA polymerase-1
MLVGRSSFSIVLEKLMAAPILGLDTETSGLRPFHGDRLFSLILSTGQEHFYFNFWAYPDMDPETVLSPDHLAQMKTLFSDPSKTWRVHNLKFDAHMLHQEGIELAGTLHCTKALSLVEYNEHMSYSLSDCAERIGEKKDDAVEAYISDHSLWEWSQVPGKNKRSKNKFFYKVPPAIIVPYGEKDAHLHYRLGESQEKAFDRLDQEFKDASTLPRVRQVVENERRLTRTVLRMERVGVKIDRPYCVRAARYEADRSEKAVQQFKSLTGRDFKASPKLFAEVFADQRDRWEWNEPTKTGQVNPCFESEVLKKFNSPVADAVLQYRDAKSKSDFYQGFLYHADQDDVVHPNFNQDGAGHGRFSSSEPNFQNLTSEEEAGDLDQEFLVRRATIPRPGFVFLMPDYDQMEYRVLFDVACQILGYESKIVTEIKAGKDPHQATADVVCAMGGTLTRKRAKNGNFAWLYGSGDQTLADTIGGTLEEAQKLRSLMRRAAPEVAHYIHEITKTARLRGFIFNWFGRRCHFPDPRFAYRAPNYHISGGCADVVKVAMNRLDELFLGTKSRMVMTIHDELPTECHESELSTVPRQMVEIMSGVYPSKYLPLTVGMEWSDKSLGDKRKGFPV